MSSSRVRRPAHGGRTYGTKSASAHRIMRTHVSSNWLDSSIDESSGTDADPMLLLGKKKNIVALADDSSSSAGSHESSPDRHCDRVPDSDAGSTHTVSDRASSLAPSRRRSRSVADEEDLRQGNLLADPATRTKASTSSNFQSYAKSRALIEVLIPQPRQQSRSYIPPTFFSKTLKETLSDTEDTPRLKTRSRSPLRTTNGARPTDALADLIRRSKRPKTASAEDSDVQSENIPITEPRRTRSSSRAPSPAPSLRRSARRSSISTPSASEGESNAKSSSRSKTDMLASATSSLRALALEPHKVPRKSGSLILIDVPARTDRSYPPALPRLPDQDKTPRPEIRRLRGSLSEMPSSDPDSLRVAHGSSPFKRRKLHSESDEEISTEDEDDEDSDEEADDSSMTRQDQAKAASAMEMSLRDHRTILGPDVKSVDENMTTLLAACGQKTFIPFSKVLTLLGAAPAPPRNKKGSSSHGKGSRTIVKIGEATYSEVFRLTTTVTSRSGDRKGKARDKEIETWEERKVLKIVPIRKDRPAENERKHMLPSIIAPTLTGNGKSRTDTESDNGEGTRRRGARDRAPTLKRKEADERGIEEMLAADAHKRKRARESAASDGPELSTARDVQREIEITRALGSLNPDGGAGGAFGSFVKLHAAHIVAGPYPKRLLDAWDDFHEAREGGSENWRPDVLEHNQVFAVIVLGDGGRNLEHSSLDSWQQAASIFWQLVHAIATAEMAIQFEHRDLHWGNVLISPRPPEIEPLRSAVLKEKQASALNVLTAPRSAARQAAPSLVSATTTVNFLANAADRGRRALLKNNNGPVSLARRSNSTPDAFARSLEAQHAGIYATIIDFALSRVVLEPGEGVRDEASDDEMEIRQKRILAYDFEDEEIFQGKGDPQFEVYRDMRDLVQGDWHTFRPITNVMWLSFFIGKLTETGKLKRPQIKNGKTYAGAEHRERYYYSFLRHCQRRIHTSVENVLEEAFDVRDANAKAARTGRPVEDFLPKANGKAGGDRDVEKKGGSKPLTSAKALLRWMRREVERLEDGYHAGEI